MSLLKGDNNIIDILKGNTRISKVMKGSSLYYSSGLPKGYQRIGYIQSNGNQFINSGIIADLDTKVEVKFRYTSVPTITSMIVGTHGTSTSNNAFIFGCASSGKLYSRIDNKSTATSDVNADTDWHVAVIDKTGAKLDGEQLVSFDNPTSFESSYPIYLFCSKDGSGSIQYRASADIDYIKIWKNGVLVFNGESAIEVATGDLGIYDKVSETLLENSGTGTFGRGAVIVDGFQECEWINSDGASGTNPAPYIKSGIIPDNSTGVHMIGSFTNVSSDSSRFGIRESSETDSRYTFGTASNKVYFGWKTTIPANADDRPNVVAGTFYDIKHNYLNDRKCQVDNVACVENLTTLSVDYTHSIILFGFGIGDEIRCRQLKTKLIQISKGNEIVRYFIPMYRTSDTEIGLYDIVERKFYPNESEVGSFTKGSDV